MSKVTPTLTPIDRRDLHRIGPNGDGGYVVVESVSKNINVLISAGVGEDILFEKEFYARYGAKGILIDPYISHEVATASSAELVLRKKLGSSSPKDNYECASIEELISSAKDISGISNPRLALKMDIEWDEWAVLESESSETLSKFDQILVEFHLIPFIASLGPTLSNYFASFQFQVQNKANAEIANRYARIIEKISQNFSCIHLHANNSLGAHSLFGEVVPYLLEATFVNKSIKLRGVQGFKTQLLGQQLDFPNKSDRPDLSGFHFQGHHG